MGVSEYVSVGVSEWVLVSVGVGVGVGASLIMSGKSTLLVSLVMRMSLLISVSWVLRMGKTQFESYTSDERWKL